MNTFWFWRSDLGGGLARRRLGLPTLLLIGAIAIAQPAWATAMVGGLSYDESRRTLFIETSGMPLVQTKRLINPDRLVIDVMDAVLPGAQTKSAAVRSSRIRGYRAAQYGQSPSVVRIVLELQPGFEPLVEVHQTPGRVALTIDDPPPPTGERDLETLPPQIGSIPTPAPTPVSSLPTPLPTPSAPPVVILPSPDVQPTPTVTPSPIEPTPAPVVTPSPIPEPQVVSVVPAARKPQGFGSMLMLRWQQAEALDDYGAPTGPVFAYPTGFNGLEMRHWTTPFVGFGLDSRVLTYDVAAEGVRTNRTDLMVLPEVVARYPLWDGRFEPEASLGYMGRQVNVYSNQIGKTTFPFSPTQFYDGFAVGLGGRIRLLPSLSLAVSYQYLPAVGGGLFKGLGVDYGTIFPLTQSRVAIALQYEIGPGYTTLGYSDETSKNRGIGFTQSITGIFAGVGWRY